MEMERGREKYIYRKMGIERERDGWRDINIEIGSYIKRGRKGEIYRERYKEVDIGRYHRDMRREREIDLYIFVSLSLYFD
jgi:hypothetical protein